MKKILIIAVGIIFIGAGGFLYFKNSNLRKKCTEEVEAIVVDMKEELSIDDGNTTYMYYPIIEYIVGNDTIKKTIDHGSSSPDYSINEKITIMYNPNQVEEFIVKGDNSSNIFSILFMSLGVIITGFGLVNLFKKDN